MFNGCDKSANTTTTDVSVRVENINGALRDVVTFCGITKTGVSQIPFGWTSTMVPHLPFDPPAPSTAPSCSAPAGGGDTHNAISPLSGTVEWDGYVGRVSRLHDNSGSVQKEFFSIVGGIHEDGLFGLAEIDNHRFVVVGATGIGTNTPGSPSYVFPLTKWNTWNDPADLCFHSLSGCQMGVCMVFDASATRNANPGRLILERSQLLGSHDSSTVARDVAVVGEWIYVVGSTVDPRFNDSFPGAAEYGFVGPLDGFVAVRPTNTGSDFKDAICLMAKPGEDWLTGVVGWNEYPDHAFVAGASRPDASSPSDLFAAKVFVDTTSSGGVTLSLLQLQLSVEVGVKRLIQSNPDSMNNNIITLHHSITNHHHLL